MKNKEMMSWSDCQATHIKQVEADDEKIKSMRKMCAVRLKVTKAVKLDEETASIIAADYYEVIKELLTALLLKNGLKSDNHECLIAFFNHKFPEYEYETKIIYQLKEVRNKVSYNGIFVKKGYIEMNKLEFEYIIGLLNKLLDK